MKYFKSKYIIILFFSFLIPFGLKGEVRYHCSSDSLKVAELLQKAQEGETYGDRIVAAAKALTGIPYGSASDNDSIGTIVIRLDSLNQREFINMALAAAKSTYAISPGLSDFEKALENISRRKGVDEGFASQFLYGSDWIIDNAYRGNIKEMTDYFEGGNFRTKTLDYVSRHKEQFPALADSIVMDKVKVVEMGYRSHRIPHQKKHNIGNKKLIELFKNGDIIMMLSPDPDFDIYDLGIVVLKDDQPHLIHISREEGKVVEDEYPLQRLFKIEGQFFYGFRWLRPTEQ